MCRNITAEQIAAIKIAESKARLVAKNKEAAREQLLRIQLLLAQRSVVGK